MFSGFVFYYYKFNLNVQAAQVTLRYSHELSRVAIAMGATVGFSVLTFIIGSLFPVFYDATLASAGVMDLAQHVMIMTTFMCTKKIYSLCKACITRD